MGTKVCIVGAGHVGATIAYTLLVAGIASELVMLDINKEKVNGEVMDLKQGTAFCAPVCLYAGEYCDAVGSDLVILTSGIGRKPGQSRIDLAQSNVEVMKSILPPLVKYAPNALYIVVSNPVDILTHVITKISGLPVGHVIGSGTLLDTARLQSILAESVNLSPRSVHAYVLGEHGDSSVVPWSLASIGGMPLEQYMAQICPQYDVWKEEKRDQLASDMRKSGSKIIAGKGATYYAVSVAVTHLCECLLGGNDSVLTVSSSLQGSYDIHDVALSLPTVVGREGIRRVLTPVLLPEEEAALHKSAETLKAVLHSLSF